MSSILNGTKPDISVIIPIYNTADFLGICLDSLLHQSFKHFEAILINDGSTDQSESIAKRYAEADSRFTLISQSNAGLSEARNAGLKIAKGQWITFIDSDDMVASDYLQALLDDATQLDCDIACCGKRHFERTPPIKHTAKSRAQALSPTQAVENALYQQDRPDYSAWNKLYSAKLWANREFPKGKYFEDMATIPQIFFDAKKISFSPTPLYFYRIRKQSILNSAYDKKKAELLDIAESICKPDGIRHSPSLLKAAQCNLFSASCSILMRTPDTADFDEYKKRAWGWITKYRTSIIFSTKTRLRNKIAAMASYVGFNNFIKITRSLG